MKYLFYEELEQLNEQISVLPGNESKIITRIEAYSCKSTYSDKKLYHNLACKWDSVVQVSSASDKAGDQVSLKTLFYLIATLNVVYPDYDFTDTTPDSFFKIPSIDMIKRLINSYYDHFHSLIVTRIWTTIDPLVQLDDCVFYQFVGNELDELNLQSCLCFLVNLKLKRLIFVTVRHVRFVFVI
jgi:hypothetical protein